MQRIYLFHFTPITEIILGRPASRRKCTVRAWATQICRIRLMSISLWYLFFFLFYRLLSTESFFIYKAVILYFYSKFYQICLLPNPYSYCHVTLSCRPTLMA